MTIVITKIGAHAHKEAWLEPNTRAGWVLGYHYVHYASTKSRRGTLFDSGVHQSDRHIRYKVELVCAVGWWRMFWLRMVLGSVSQKACISNDKCFQYQLLDHQPIQSQKYFPLSDYQRQVILLELQSNDMRAKTESVNTVTTPIAFDTRW